MSLPWCWVSLPCIFTNIIINVLFYHGDCYCYWHLYVHGCLSWINWFSLQHHQCRTSHKSYDNKGPELYSYCFVYHCPQPVADLTNPCYQKRHCMQNRRCVDSFRWVITRNVMGWKRVIKWIIRVCVCRDTSMCIIYFALFVWKVAAKGEVTCIHFVLK